MFVYLLSLMFIYLLYITELILQELLWWYRGTVVLLLWYFDIFNANSAKWLPYTVHVPWYLNGPTNNTVKLPWYMPDNYGIVSKRYMDLLYSTYPKHQDITAPL